MILETILTALACLIGFGAWAIFVLLIALAYAALIVAGRGGDYE